MSATIRDIKNQTGLSLATISKYLNGGNVLPENRVKIEAAIRELHYEVNELARGLVTSRTKTVGVVVYAVESLFNGTLIKYIGKALRKLGYGLLICDSDNDEELEERNIRYLLNKKVDGIIAVPVSSDGAFLKPAREADVPVVLIDRPLKDSSCDCVRIDNRQAALRAVRVLIANGHRDIAVISSEREYTAYERYHGFLEAMDEAGLSVPEEYICLGGHSFEGGNLGMKRLLELSRKPSAVFMTNYEVTLGAVMALNDSGLSCPEDISFLGFDDLIMSHIIKPRITRVVQPMSSLGEKAVELLLNHIENGEELMTTEIVLGTGFMEGDSIRALE
ncbi:MAG: LacI family transcriptional regulator [Lachnospiraceae bacterium]|nr:LacI family transcriptional regulator [Lachnospiraceae bacterium]